MEFSDLIEGRLIQRYKRFLADVELADGSVVTAHCANPGSMKSCIEPTTRAWLSRARPGRKLGYTWELAQNGDTWIFVNPVRANLVVEETIRAGMVPELGGYDALEREVRYGEGSRIDLLLSSVGQRCYVEVKNVTLSLGGGRAAFPDSVTKRGTKHLEELIRVRQKGDRAVLFFCVSRSDVRSVEPADAIDPEYGQALRRAARAGVEILAYGGPIGRGGIRLETRVAVDLRR